MANTPLKISPELTFHELSSIVRALEEARRGSDYSIAPYTDREDKDGFVTEEDGVVRVVEYRVTNAEAALNKREVLAELIGKLTGVTPQEDYKVVAGVLDARRRLNLQEAADKLAAELTDA